MDAALLTLFVKIIKHFFFSSSESFFVVVVGFLKPVGVERRFTTPRSASRLFTFNQALKCLFLRDAETHRNTF